jgi:hypothetical protein
MKLVALAAVVGLLGLLGPPAVSLAAGEYQLVVQDGVPAEVGRAAAADLDRCFPFVSAALRTPSPHTKVYLYGTQDAFVRGLQEIGRFNAQTAARSGRLFTHVAANETIFLYGPRFGALSAYERAYGTCLVVGLVFQAQLLTPRRVDGPHWVRQGHAWMLAQAAAVQFGVDNAAQRQERDIRGLREMRDRAGGFPRLASIGTLEAFQDAIERYTSAGVSYFLRHAAQFLTAKSSSEAFATYYRGLAMAGSTAPDPAAVFRGAFKMTPEQFQAQFDEYLADLVK